MCLGVCVCVVSRCGVCVCVSVFVSVSVCVCVCAQRFHKRSATMNARRDGQAGGRLLPGQN